jgi:hypothetical protein
MSEPQLTLQDWEKMYKMIQDQQDRIAKLESRPQVTWVTVLFYIIFSQIVLSIIPMALPLIGILSNYWWVALIVCGIIAFSMWIVRTTRYPIEQKPPR